MKGADEYYDLFNGVSQQIGRLFFMCHKHARGKCFEIFLLPEGEDSSKWEWESTCVKHVCVYGVIGGQRGWTEEYGWIHTGKWQIDFNEIIEKKHADLHARRAIRTKKIKEEKERKDKELAEYLADY